MDHCKKCSEYHRKVQKLESEIVKLKKQLSRSRVDPWASESRKAEAIERDNVAAVIQNADAVKAFQQFRETVKDLLDVDKL
jgi:hypothetical protein